MSTNKKDAKKSFLSSDEQDDSQIKKNKIGDWRAFISLAVYAKPHWKRLSLGIGLVFISSTLAILSAKYMGELVEKGLMVKDLDESIRFCSIIITLELLFILGFWMGRTLISQASSKVILNIRESLFAHLQVLPLKFFDRQPQGRVVTRITHDVESIEQFFSGSLSRLVSAAITASLALLAMIFTFPKLGVVLALSISPALVFVFSTRNSIRVINRKMSKMSSACNAKLSEFLSGLDVIRAHGLEKWSKNKYEETVDSYLKSQLHANTVYGWTRPLVSFLCGLPLVALVWFGGKSLLAGTITVGLFVTYVRYCERFFNPIRTLAAELHVIQQAFTSAERVASFLRHETENSVLGEEKTVVPIKKMKGEIVFDDLSMFYEKDNWILNGLNFKIMPGEKVGLVGTTGCGKTTTVSLLSRLYEYQKGNIEIDGQSIRNFPRSFLRKKIGFVSQDVVIFRGTLRQNISPETDLTDDTLFKTCQLTGFDEVMADRELTFDSEVLEGGANLSIGEKQLLSLTRVLARDPSILVLDEATANIDPEFEGRIHIAIERAMAGRTCLIIAHRLDTLKICDRILVFDKGQLVEDGKENDLYEKRGHFYRLHTANLL